MELAVHALYFASLKYILNAVMQGKKSKTLNHKILQYLFGVVLLFAIQLTASATIGRGPMLPNIVLINIDDLGWRDVGFMGSEYYETPNIDKLAAKGTIFTNAYSSAANCAPSRACMMSGKWTPRHGIYTVDNSDRGNSKDRKLIPTTNTITLNDSFLTLPEVLKQSGYTTCIAGKWHLSDDPKKRGFDVNIGGNHAGNPGSYYPPYTNVASLIPPSKDYYLTNLIMDKALDFVNSTQEKPFFLYYAPYAVHTPIQPVKELLGKYDNKQKWNGQSNAGYATMIENVDSQIGRLIQTLSTTGKLNNTFIIFTSDNGGVYEITKQWPLRAGKGSPYEGGIRVPTFMVWKGNISAGKKNDLPISNIDFFPTILNASGIKPPAGLTLDGQNILASSKRKLNKRPLFWHFPVYLEAGNIECQDVLFRTRPGSAIRLGKWKLIQYFENNDIELFDLKKDIAEKHNLAKERPLKVQELSNLLEKWRTDTHAPVPNTLNPFYSTETKNNTQ